jgi:uncharacterized repeat protein (TIGR03803 family)
MNANRWFFRLNRLLIMIAALTLATAASAEWKEKALYSFQGSPDAATPAGGVVFDKAGNLYGAALGGPQGSQGTVFQLVPPAKKGDPWTEAVLYVFQGKPVNDGQIPTGGLIIDSAGNLYGVTGYGGAGNCVLLGILVGCGTVYELSPPAQRGGAWTETVLYSFPDPKQGYLPNGNLVFDNAGNLYGATTFGGGRGTNCNSFYQYCGAVFELSPPKKKGGKWTEKVLHGFKGGTDGANPNGGLVFDSKGAIYGTTFAGGYNCPHNSGQGCGTVFKLASPTMKGGAWTEEVLDRFNPGNSGAAEPVTGVIFDQGGNLYGTTLGGGNSGSGTIFQLATRSNGTWRERVLYRFRDGNDGSAPRGGVIFDAKGDLYGTASGGGTVGGGTVFGLKPTKQGHTWVFVTLYTFTGTPDGSYPTGSLIFDKTGNVFGTTQQSGNTGQNCGHDGCGTVFEVKGAGPAVL